MQRSSIISRRTPSLYIWFSWVQSLSCVRLFATPWTAALQASLSITNSQSLPKLSSIELVIPSNHLILCHPLLLLPLIFPSIRVFSNDSPLHIRRPKYWRFSFISPSNEHPGLREFWLISGSLIPGPIENQSYQLYLQTFWHRPLSPQLHHCLPGPVLYYRSQELLQLPSIITFFSSSFLYIRFFSI